MTPEEWPIWTPPERGGLAPAPRAGRDRLPTVRADFFLNERFRLTEQERALMTAMLHRLVGDVAAEIQAAVPEDWLPANEDNEGLLERISNAGLLDINDLVALLLRRTDEERVALACMARTAQPPPNLVQPLIGDGDGEVAAAAMAVLIARGRRRDKYGRPLVEFDDVDPQTARALVFAVAAGLFERLPVDVPASEAESQLGRAASVILAHHEPAKSLDSVLARLVGALFSAGRLDEDALLSAMQAAEVAFVAHALAVKAAIAPAVAFDELMCQDARRVMMLLRLANTSKPLAARLVAMFGDLIGLPADPYNLEAFDAATVEQQDAARAWLQLDPSLQASLRHLGHGRGHRPV